MLQQLRRSSYVFPSQITVSLSHHLWSQSSAVQMGKRKTCIIKHQSDSTHLCHWVRCAMGRCLRAQGALSSSCWVQGWAYQCYRLLWERLVKTEMKLKQFEVCEGKSNPTDVFSSTPCFVGSSRWLPLSTLWLRASVPITYLPSRAVRLMNWKV